MKKILTLLSIVFGFSLVTFAQDKDDKEKREKIKVPAAVKQSLSARYPDAKHIAWEKEKGNYEANWGGKSGEDHSVQFTPSGEFIEMVNAIAVTQLPKPVFTYIKQHYKGAKITEAGRVTDANGKISYEAEVKKKDILFDEKGNFIKVED